MQTFFKKDKKKYALRIDIKEREIIKQIERERQRQNRATEKEKDRKVKRGIERDIVRNKEKEWGRK